jgi:glycosyltransferase involved in cell wall biosynthesis
MVVVMKKRIITLVNSITPTSFPVEIASNIDDSFESIILSLYDTEKEAIKKAEDNNIVKQVIGMGLKNRFNIFKYKKISDLFRELNPDIIHTHHTFSGFTGRLLSRDSSVITTIHTDMRYLNLKQKILQTLNLNLADYIVCNSNNTRDSFLPWQNRLIDPAKKILIYNGVDIKRILNYNYEKSTRLIKQKYGILDKTFIIGNIGRLERPKDQKTLLRAFRLFKEKVADSRLIIVGGGSLAEELKALARDLKISDEVIFTGLVSRDEAYRIINTLDLFVVPSIYEGFCNAMVEAMVAGKPIIASNIEPLPEVLGYNNGLFFKKANYNELYNKMLMFFEDRILREAYAEKAVSYACQHYSLEKCISEYTELYKRILRR